jgi:hypothetical protein
MVKFQLTPGVSNSPAWYLCRTDTLMAFPRESLSNGPQVVFTLDLKYSRLQVCCHCIYVVHGTSSWHCISQKCKENASGTHSRSHISLTSNPQSVRWAPRQWIYALNFIIDTNNVLNSHDPMVFVETHSQGQTRQPLVFISWWSSPI